MANLITAAILAIVNKPNSFAILELDHNHLCKSKITAEVYNETLN